MMSKPWTLTYASAYIGSEKPVILDELGCTPRDRLLTGELRDVLEVGDEVFSDLNRACCTSNVLVGLQTRK
jgi:hypothetical protein